MDTMVLFSILKTDIVELQDVICEHGGTNRQAWVAIEEQFFGNRKARSLHIDIAFRTFVQGGHLRH